MALANKIDFEKLNGHSAKSSGSVVTVSCNIIIDTLELE